MIDIATLSPASRQKLEANALKLLAEAELFEFVRQAWSIVEPEMPFADNWHIRGICEHLEAVAAGQIKKLLINVPPGTMKSLLVAVFFPAWVWTTRPHKRFMFSSYAASLSLRDGGKCRDIVRSQWYQNRWPLPIKSEMDAVKLFGNAKGGWRLATSVGGAGTGLHPDYNCLRGDNCLTSRHGQIKISDIVSDAKPVELLSYNHHSRKLEWKTATSFKKYPGKPCVEIKTGGRKIVCTHDHPIFVFGRGYVAAATVAPGDKVASHCQVRDVPYSFSKDASSCCQTRKAILFTKMFRSVDPWRESSALKRIGTNNLSELRQGCYEAEAGNMGEMLFVQMPFRTGYKKQAVEAVRALRQILFSTDLHPFASPVLFVDLFIESPQSEDRWKEKRSLAERTVDQAIQERIPQRSKVRSASGRLLSDMRNESKAARQATGRSPCELRQDRESAFEFGFALPLLPRQFARWKKIAAVLDFETVEFVGDAGTPDFVYNVGVVGNHNYFADGLLNHNCFDDPHNTKEAESDAERQSAIEWWDGTMSSRGVIRDVAQVGVMQRLHEKDLSGHLMAKGNWEHICLPMRYEAARPKNPKVPPGDDNPLIPRMRPTSLGWNDPRTIDGELLWPELYTEAKTANLEIDLGPYYTAGQLQQRPSPRGGGMFKREWFDQIIQALPSGVIKWVRYWDKAGCAGGTGARTAGVLMAKLPIGGRHQRHQYLIADVIADRWNAVEREAVIAQTAALDAQRFGYVETWVEQEPGSGGKESAESTVTNNAGFTFRIERVTGSKEVRAEPLSAQCAVGNVLLYDDPTSSKKWIPGFIDEAELFPNGKLKDQIDAGGGAFNKLAVPSGGLSCARDLGVPSETKSLSDRLPSDKLSSADLG